MDEFKRGILTIPPSVLALILLIPVGVLLGLLGRLVDPSGQFGAALFMIWLFGTVVFVLVRFIKWAWSAGPKNPE